MATKAGKTDLRVEIDSTLAQQLEMAAAGKTKREVVEAPCLGIAP
jgi:hypothetical protein